MKIGDKIKIKSTGKIATIRNIKTQYETIIIATIGICYKWLRLEEIEIVEQ